MGFGGSVGGGLAGFGALQEQRLFEPFQTPHLAFTPDVVRLIPRNHGLACRAGNERSLARDLSRRVGRR
jgi:hypothetical protein